MPAGIKALSQHGRRCPERQAAAVPGRRTWEADMGFRITSETKTNDVIGSDSLRFTTTAGIASVFAAVVGAAIPVLDKITALNVSENVKIAMLGLVGAGVVGYAIASAGDVLARAYATAHVHPAEATQKDGKEIKSPPMPASEYAVGEFVKRLDQIVPALKDALAAPGHRLSIVPLPEAISVKTRLHDDCKVVALCSADGNDPEHVLYLVARKGAGLELKAKEEMEVV
jgi:hypothetical protein